jgi:hypothetical protein
MSRCHAPHEEGVTHYVNRLRQKEDHAPVSVTLEIEANVPGGVPDEVIRIVTAVPSGSSLKDSRRTDSAPRVSPPKGGPMLNRWDSSPKRVASVSQPKHGAI